MLVLRAPDGVEAVHLDFVVEVADVADDGLVLHLPHVLQRDDVAVAGAGDVDIAAAQGVLDGGDLEAFHGGLQGVDGVDLGDHDARAHAAQRMRRALAHVAVAAHHRDLAGHHHVGGALDAVGQRFAAAVEVVELRLGDRVVDVDGGNQQRAGFLHLVQAVHAGGGLLGNAAPFLHHVVPARRVFGVDPLQQVLDDLLLVAAGGRVHPAAAVLQLVAFVDEQRGVAAVVHDQLRALAAGMAQRLRRCTTSSLRAFRPSRRRPARRWRQWRRRRGPAWRRCCSSPSAPRRPDRPASRSARPSGWSCAASR